MDPEGLSTTAGGAVIGGLIGGPPGAVAGAVVGTILGAVLGKVIWDTWFSEEDAYDEGDACPVPPADPSQPPGEGWEWRGRGEPGSKEGSWYNPGTGESLHPDLDHAPPIGPHWDYKDPRGNKIRIPTR